MPINYVVVELTAIESLVLNIKLFDHERKK